MKYSVAKVLALGERCCILRGQVPTNENVGVHLGVDKRVIARWRAGQVNSVRWDVADRIETLTGFYVGHLEAP